METLLQDLRFAARSLRRTPGFTAVAVLTLALGIGVTTTVFTVLDGTLLRPLPYAEPDGLVGVSTGLLGAEYDIVREESRTLRDVALYQPGVGFSLSGGGEPERVTGSVVTPNLFGLLGAGAHLGRPLAPGESRPGEDAVVVLSHALWQQRYGGDPGIVGAEVMVDGVARTVVGVMPADFYFPQPGTGLWVPLRLDPANLGSYWGMWGGYVVGRLAPGATPAGAAAEFRGFGDRLRRANPLWTPGEDYMAAVEVSTLRESMTGDVRPLLLVLLGSVGFVLLIACANIGNLLLARGLSREKEIAVRAAVGASRRRVVRQLLTESVLLALLGGMAGALASVWGVHAFLGLLPADIPRQPEIALDARALGFALAATLTAGIAAGLFPAWRVARRDLREALKPGGGSGVGAARRRLSSTLVVAEVALALVLVTAAGLLIRSMQQLLGVDPGFRTEQVVTARVSPPPGLYPDVERRRAFYRDLLEHTAALPGVSGVAATSQLPFDQEASGAAVFIRGVHTDPRAPLPTFEQRRVTPDFFSVMGIPLLAGRTLAQSDRADAPPVVVIDETAARRFWPDEDPIGREIGFPWADRWMTVVGVVGSVRNNDLAGEREPAMYVPFAQDPMLAMTLTLRTGVEPGVLAPAIQAVATTLDPAVPVSHVQPMARLVAGSVSTPRGTAVLLGAFASLALFLAAIGVYGIVAHSVRQRTREIGVRVALGARGADVLGMVVRQGAVLAGAGVVVGLLAAFGLTRVLRGLLFQVSPTDPATFAAVALLLVGIAVLASYLPARRAARVDPMVALRAE